MFDLHDQVASVRLRRMPGSKAFKGSCFIEFSTNEDAEKAAAATFSVKDDSGDEVDLKVLPKTVYFEQKREERNAKKKEREERKGSKGQASEPVRRLVVSLVDCLSPRRQGAWGHLTFFSLCHVALASSQKFTPGCVIALSGLATETSREHITEALQDVADVAWVDFQRGETEVCACLHLWEVCWPAITQRRSLARLPLCHSVGEGPPCRSQGRGARKVGGGD